MLSGQLWGITAEGWVAIATFVGAASVLLSGTAVFFKAREFLSEQEARDVRRYLVDDGVWKLRDSLERILQITRLNYGRCQHQLRHVRDIPSHKIGTIQLQDLPHLHQMNPLDFAFAAIRPSSLLLGETLLSNIATTALARINNVNEIFTNEVEVGVRTYYSGALDMP